MSNDEIVNEGSHNEIFMKSNDDLDITANGDDLFQYIKKSNDDIANDVNSIEMLKYNLNSDSCESTCDSNNL
eukprot:CAMPEP_0196762748 /NCGR_PEP_ID=MMETSP1095-20130614/2689_1 /TAXON_ID=96789 ORGANISM="Chromulina nebulosa, Strain UTEXLB2642" /NCGR_SAMPLE_ID=MMETSP1095 /ASSEMBLY_ACC=CAM_ASM_000446 /LENGTH=71 /DNA_ID=CAMNT_0042114445 /DNA_START=87 /DNA_END=298 /DNA_ORIENTATION=+